MVSVPDQKESGGGWGDWGDGGELLPAGGRHLPKQA